MALPKLRLFSEETISLSITVYYFITRSSHVNPRLSPLPTALSPAPPRHQVGSGTAVAVKLATALWALQSGL
jgi:hypothetical protein